MSTITDKDRQVVRDLAKRVAELAADPAGAAKVAEWRRHNRFQPGKPMVLVSFEDVWDELVPDAALRCADEEARSIERQLRHRLYLAEHIRDDRPVTATWEVGLKVEDPGCGCDWDWYRPEPKHGRTGAAFRKVIPDDADPEKVIHPRELTVDREGTQETFEQMSHLFGDILDVRIVGKRMFCYTPADCLAVWRGIEQFFWDLVDRPKWIHELLERLTQSDLYYSYRAEEEGVLELNNGDRGFDVGPQNITDELPAEDFDGEHVRLRDLWGVAAAQIFSEVSPDMHEEFGIQYEARCLAPFGLNAYGCCEPLHRKVHLIRKLPRVRRVSMSPWVDWVEGAEQIGSDFIYSAKPTPSLLQTERWDIEPCRREVVTILDAAKGNGCTLELILNGTLTCRGEPRRYDEWTDMVQNLARKYA